MYKYGSDDDPNWVAWQELKNLDLLEKYAGSHLFFSEGLLLAHREDGGKDLEEIAGQILQKTGLPVFIYYVPKKGEYFPPETITAVA